MKKKIILQSTLQLISERGVHNTPMSKIAKHAGVAVGTIYHHFDSKEQILNELYLEIKQEFGNRINAVLAKDLSARETFSEVFRTLYTYYTEHPLKFIFTEQVAFTPIITEEVKQKAQKFYQNMITYLENRVSDGTLRDLPVELLGQLYYGNIKTLVHMELTAIGTVTEAMLDDAIHTSWISFAAG